MTHEEAETFTMTSIRHDPFTAPSWPSLFEQRRDEALRFLEEIVNPLHVRESGLPMCIKVDAIREFIKRAIGATEHPDEIGGG